METQYVYVKSRSQFGKQCIFDDSDTVAEQNIFPNHAMMKDYININSVHQSAQVSTQFAVHEIQTENTVMKETGMNHTEGGWPKEINSQDEEVVARFRRRIEKDDMWAPRMRELMAPMESCILQNNVLNIYENYFDDITPTNLVEPLGVRTVNVFEYPGAIFQPITHLTWSPDHETRLAASYCSMDFRRNSFSDSDLYSYIWDIENPNKPFMALKAVHPSVTIEFNPRDPLMLISGLLSGQVCNWDIRTGNTPILMSHPRFSHRQPANCVRWINSKTNTEFFSASTDGTIKWWDIRMLNMPTEILIMDFENSLRSDMVKAVGVSALQFESTMSTKFMAGMVNGVVISGTRKGKTLTEKMQLKFDCHYGPVIALDRNPFNLKNFLTIGDWTTKIWSEDTKEGNLVSTRHHGSILTGGCWSTSRCSVFYVINNDGMMEIFDILVGIKAPVMMTRLSEDCLKAIAPQETGKLLAVGNSKGKIFIVEPSGVLTTNLPNDKNLLTAYLDRCSRYCKVLDNRLKERNILHQIDYRESASAVPTPKPKVEGKKGSPRKLPKEKKVNETKNQDKDKKKIRQGKTKNIWELFGDSSLADIEKKYIETIEKEKQKYTDAALTGSEKLIQVPSTHSGLDSSVKRKGKLDDVKTDKAVSKKHEQKQRPAKKKDIKDKVVEPSEEIIIVKRKSDTPAERIVDDDLTEGKLDKQKMEIIADKMIREEKYLERTLRDDEMRKMLSERKEKSKAHESITDSQEEEVDTILEDVEESKMNALIQEMLAGYPKNILPSNEVKDLQRYIRKHKKLMKKEDVKVQSISDKALNVARREIVKPTKVIEPNKLIQLMKNLKYSSASENNKNVKDFVQESAAATTTTSASATALAGHGAAVESSKIISNEKTQLSSRENVKSKGEHEIPTRKIKKKLIVNDCQSLTDNFGVKEIADIIGVKTNIPKSSTVKSPKVGRKSITVKDNYSKITDIKINKKNSSHTQINK